MERSIDFERRVIWTYMVASSVAIIVLIALAVQNRRVSAGSELTVQRINIVDADGTLRMVISNKDRMHPGVIGGKLLVRPRPLAGLIFFNDEGNEDGGLVYTGRNKTASAGITFDQYDQDQIVGLSYDESNGRRTAGLHVWDRADIPLAELKTRFEAAQRLPPAEKAAAYEAMGANDNGAQRVFIGKNADRDAEVVLSDRHGHARLRLKVDDQGGATVDFLDASGAVTRRLGPGAENGKR